MLIASAMSAPMAVTAPRCSPMDSVGTVAHSLHSLPLSASLWVLPTGRERLPTQRASQWSPATRERDRDTLWQAPTVCGLTRSRRIQVVARAPSKNPASSLRKVGQPSADRARMAGMTSGALPSTRPRVWDTIGATPSAARVALECALESGRTRPAKGVSTKFGQ